MRRFVSVLLVLALIFPTTLASATLPPTINFKISGFDGASISVYNELDERIMYAEDGMPKSRYIEPGTNLRLEWQVNEAMEHMVLINDIVYTGSETQTSLITPNDGEVYEFDLINHAEVDAIIEINEPNLTVESGTPPRCSLGEVPEQLVGRINLDTRVIAVDYKITRNGEIVEQEALTTADEWQIDNPNFADGENLLQITVLTIYGKQYKKLINFNISDSARDEADDDSDKLPNWVEDALGTDKGAADTDGDGLRDSEERALQTKLDVSDTDEDGLMDGMERKYAMDPRNPDTLGDGIRDGDRQFTVSLDSEDAFDEYGIRPSIELALNGTQIDSLSIEKVSDSDPLLSKEVPGFIGNAFDFNVDGAFDTATMTFEFPEALLSNPEFEPAIYYFDEEDQLLIELENQTIAGNRVSASVEHFSRYMLLNKNLHSKVWEFEFKFDEDSTETFENLDIAFVIDSSGSMTSNDRNGVRKTVTNEFIDKLTTTDRAAIIDFDSYATLYAAFTSDKDVLKAAVGRINSNGGANLTSGISMAIGRFTAAEYVNNNALKVIVMLTDGEGSYNTALTQQAADNNIIIYTVGLGSSIDTDLLKAMAEGTTGNYYHASDASKLYNIFDKIAQESDFGKDSDKDGLNDYFEKEMNAGRLRLGTGVSLLGLEYLKADTDGDTLKDGNEISVVKKDPIFSKPKIYAKLTSNPTLWDTDGDSMSDKLDEFPLYYSVIDYLGSDKHLAYFEVRLEEKIQIIGAHSPVSSEAIGMLGTALLMEDNYSFLESRNVAYKNKLHGEYWRDSWDAYWDEYCDRINDYAHMQGSVGQRLHYFWNNLNRAPEDFDEIIAESHNWDLLPVKASIFHMLGKDGEYNIKLISSDGKNEAVYNKDYILLDDANDPANMGTYNFAHPKENAGGHALNDVLPYYAWGNVAGIAATLLPDSEKRYNENTDAQKHRKEVEKTLGG